MTSRFGRGGFTALTRRSRLVGVAIVLTCFLSACEAEQGLLGKWQARGGTTVFEFFPDSSLTLSDAGRMIGGSWTPADSGRFKVMAGIGTSFQTWTATVNGDVLTLAIDAKTFPYDRIKP